MSDLLDKFLGRARWVTLREAFWQESSRQKEPILPWHMVLLAGLLAITPVALTVLDEFRASGTRSSNLPTLAFGICAVLAAVMRSRLGFALRSQKRFRDNLSVTHTAVALGCIPAVVILALSPALLADRHDTLVSAVGIGQAGAARPTLAGLALYLVAVAAWVAATEEFLFRGLLLSTLRRGIWFTSQRQRDLAAIFISAMIFGIAHWATWGAVPALALFGLGIGFGLAYVANGEQLMPVMLYHFVFDLASMAVSLAL